MLSLPKIEITPNKFYTIGVLCFGIIALMNTMGFAVNIMNGNFVSITSLISSAFSLIFNYAIFGFFYYLKSTLPPQNLKKGTLEDMEELLLEETK